MNTENISELPFTKIERFEEFYPDPVTANKVIKKPPYKYVIRLTKGFITETIRYKEKKKDEMERDWKKFRRRRTNETVIIDGLKK